jgi:hypothetical protein
MKSLLAIALLSTLGTCTPSQTSSVSADTYGVAALAQAYAGSGKTPLDADIAAGAADAKTGAAVVAALPPGPITQQTVTTLLTAAAAVAAKGQ